jgi:light-harvesting complex I chlorophyll a/b binding protein 1
LKFSDMPVGCFASLEAVPTLGWLQIMAFTCAAETGYAGTTAGLVAQTEDRAPGDIGGSQWTRYADPEVKAFKLNAERNNGRAAMMGITGCLIHELLGVDALYPTGGLGGAAPPALVA